MKKLSSLASRPLEGHLTFFPGLQSDWLDSFLGWPENEAGHLSAFRVVLASLFPPVGKPTEDVVPAAGHIGQAKLALLVRANIVGMVIDEQRRAHPEEARGAAQFHHSLGAERPPSGASEIGEREGEEGRSPGVEGMKMGIFRHHLHLVSLPHKAHRPVLPILLHVQL